ncbi:hypothetical protein HCU64_14405 [Methylobacterium sp. C25]|uniref:hypothetical protein n=1 Tax=Methylobacterium sp. C25 TaxID=2721622 RepID=UPI001F23C577|nr:hypothetical protein [Methylobacterium sp. C25]MCE4224951.1 hypothetical protein [Methylobacterium sp. C25]
MTQRLCLAAAFLVALSIGPAAADGLDCGKPPSEHNAGNDALAKAVTAPRSQVGANGGLREAVKRLKADGVSAGMIVDNAVAAYCPLVDGDDSLSLDRKREAVRRFASEITGYVYDPGQTSDAIIVSLPLQTALSAQVDAAAAKAGQTRDEWLLDAVKKAIVFR